MSFAPTAEQAAIVTAARTRADLVVTAGAGSGKTTTCVQVANALAPLRGLYLCFNKRNQTEAQSKMPANVTPKTFHGLAFGGFGVRYKRRLDGGRVSSQRLAMMLGVDRMIVKLRAGEKPLSAAFLAGLVMRGVDRFCQSDDLQPTKWHIPAIPVGEDDTERAAVNGLVRDALYPKLVSAWADIADEKGQLPFSHDCYLKFCQLALAAGQKVRGIGTWDFVIVDEAQDSSLCRLSVARHCAKQLVLVGDENQMIYEWNGARNVMAHESMGGAERCALSQSFRFGPAIAEVANLALGELPTELRISGWPQIESRVDVLDRPDAILCRSNGGVLAAALGALDAGHRPFVVGGVAEIVRWVEAAGELQDRGATDHPDLRLFSSWDEARTTIETDDLLDDLRMIARLVQERTVPVLLNILRRCVDEAHSDVAVSTIHKAKGLEWDEVALGSDVLRPKNDEGWRLLYVAVTRARRVLDASDSPAFNVAGGVVELAEPEAKELPGLDAVAPEPEPVRAPTAIEEALARARVSAAESVAAKTARVEPVVSSLVVGTPARGSVTWSDAGARVEVLDAAGAQLFAVAVDGGKPGILMNAAEEAFPGHRARWMPTGDGRMVASWGPVAALV